MITTIYIYKSLMFARSLFSRLANRSRSRSFSQKARTVAETLEHFKAQLNAAEDVTQARMESELIVGHVLKATREDLLRAALKPVTAHQWRQMERLTARRVRGEPLSYVTGRRPFWRHVFVCTEQALVDEHETLVEDSDAALADSPNELMTRVKGTLIPRPCTEVLIETALELIAARGQSRGTLLDLGTGSGCIAVTLLSELPTWRAVAVDVSDTALRVARVNSARILGAEQHRLEFMKSHWTAQLAPHEYDLVLANPPYIARAARDTLSDTVKLYEPDLALYGGDSGLEAHEAISQQISPFMKQGSFLLLEVGHDQHAHVIDLFARHARLRHVRTVKDYEGFDRCLVFQK